MQTNNLSPEINLWRAVLIQAGRDIDNNSRKNHAPDAKMVYHWMQGAEARLVCMFADLDYSMVRDGLTELYNARVATPSAQSLLKARMEAIKDTNEFYTFERAPINTKRRTA